MRGAHQNEVRRAHHRIRFVGLVRMRFLLSNGCMVYIMEVDILTRASDIRVGQNEAGLIRNSSSILDEF